MASRHRARLRSCILPGFACLLFFLFLFTDWDGPGHLKPSSSPHDHSSPDPHSPHPDHDNLLLTEAECNSAFPGLTQEIEYAKALGPFHLPFKNKVVLQAKIENGEVLSHTTTSHLLCGNEALNGI